MLIKIEIKGFAKIEAINFSFNKRLSEQIVYLYKFSNFFFKQIYLDTQKMATIRQNNAYGTASYFQTAPSSTSLTATPLSKTYALSAKDEFKFLHKSQEMFSKYENE